MPSGGAGVAEGAIGVEFSGGAGVAEGVAGAGRGDASSGEVRWAGGPVGPVGVVG